MDTLDEQKLRTIFSFILNCDINNKEIYSFGLSSSNKCLMVNNMTGKLYGISSIINKMTNNGNLSTLSTEEILGNISQQFIRTTYIQLKPLIQETIFCNDSILEIFKQKHQEVNQEMSSFAFGNKSFFDILNNCDTKKLFSDKNRNLLNIFKKDRCIDHEKYHISKEKGKFKIRCANCNFNCVFSPEGALLNYCSLDREIKDTMDIIVSYSDFEFIEKSFKTFQTAYQNMKSEFLLKLETIKKANQMIDTKEIDLFINSFRQDNYFYNDKARQIEFANLIFKIDDESLEVTLAYEFSRLIEYYEGVLDKNRKELETLISMGSPDIVIDCIKNVTGYGKTTYIDLLKGSQNKKMIEYGLTNSKFYGLFKAFTRIKVESMIVFLEENSVIETYYSARDSSRKYPKLRLCKNYEKLSSEIPVLNSQPTQPVPILELPKNIMTLLNGLNNNPKERKIALIEMAIEEKLIQDADFPFIIEFTLEKREFYRDILTTFVSVFSLMPRTLLPVIELNAKMETGVMQKTFKQILLLCKEMADRAAG